MHSGLDQIANTLDGISPIQSVSRVVEVRPGHVVLADTEGQLFIGCEVEILADVSTVFGEVVALANDQAVVATEGETNGIHVGCRARHLGSFEIAPDDSWIGRVIDARACPMDGHPILKGLSPRSTLAKPPLPTNRRDMGSRLVTGLAALNTILPIVRGQRIGLFAGSGVGKSNLIGTLANDIDADVIVVALIGERSREVNEFVRRILGKKGMSRSVVVAATSNTPALCRRRAAATAITVAEHFRDAGSHVLLIIDSLTRLAEAQREIGSISDEQSNFSGYPSSIVPLFAGLTERAGPGQSGQGDITALFSVLVAGSDMNEPISDTLRGMLDGHIVLSREISERGRFPAIDILRSVSRALPAAATADENKLIQNARQILDMYEKSEILIRSGLHEPGTNPELDSAIEIFPVLDRFIGARTEDDISDSFRALGSIIENKDSPALVEPDDASD